MSLAGKTAIVDLPELAAEYEEWLKIPAALRGNSFRGTMSEPRPEWHGREVVLLSHSGTVFRFLNKKSPTYHILPNQNLKLK